MAFRKVMHALVFMICCKPGQVTERLFFRLVFESEGKENKQCRAGARNTRFSTYQSPASCVSQCPQLSHRVDHTRAMVFRKIHQTLLLLETQYMKQMKMELPEVDRLWGTLDFLPPVVFAPFFALTSHV